MLNDNKYIASYKRLRLIRSFNPGFGNLSSNDSLILVISGISQITGECCIRRYVAFPEIINRKQFFEKKNFQSDLLLNLDI